MLKTRIAVFVSGGGTNLQALIDAQKSGIISDGEIALVISNNENAYAIERARNAGIEALTVTKKDCGGLQHRFEETLHRILRDRKIELIVLAGFMSILSERFTSCYPERILNVHPSLIPSFCGKGYYGLRVHEEALRYGVKVTGATVHFVNEIPDGGKIILQKAVDISEWDTAKTLQQKVMEQAEWVILPRAVQMISKKIAEKGESYERIRDI